MGKKQTLDRLLSKLGIASRGDSAELIRHGRVKINGRLARDPAAWVSWPEALVTLDGEPIKPAIQRFFLFHKPVGVVTSHSDEHGRKTIYDLLPQELGFIHAVGRLDKATSGLLLLTNDSMFSSFLTEPKNKISREYEVTVWGQFPEEKKAKAIAGVVDADEHLKCDSVEIGKLSKRETSLRVILSQGKNREIRRLFKALGHEVTRLHRDQYGPFSLGDLPLGKWSEIPLAQAKKSAGFPT